MPFGLINAPWTFQRTMHIILSLAKGQHAMVNLDDIIIFSKSSDKHIDNVRKVLTLLNDAAAAQKLKCAIFSPIADYLGNVMRSRCLAASSNAIQVIAGFQTLSNILEYRSSLGLGLVFCRFVPKFCMDRGHAQPKVSKIPVLLLPGTI